MSGVLGVLVLKTLTTVEMIVDFRKDPIPPSTIALLNSPVDTVGSCCFLGFIITRDLERKVNINSINSKAQQRMYLLGGSHRSFKTKVVSINV